MRKGRLIVSLILFMLGLLRLLNSFSSSRLEGLHGADRLQLISVGLLFGVALGIGVGGLKALDK
jgi:hypothetical protein